MPGRWIDTHVHVSAHGSDGTPRPRFLRDLLAVLDHDCSDLRFVISPDVNWVEVVRDDPTGSRRAAEFIHSLTRRAPGRLYGSCLVNLNFPDQARRTMDACFGQWRFVMLGEMLQYMMHYDMDSENGVRVVRHATAYGVPVQVHISTSNSPKQGHTSGMGELLDLLGLAERVPEAKYILGHFIGMPAADPPVAAAYLDVIFARFGKWPKNFWAEIRDFDSPGVRLALERIPVDRLLAGTDWVTRAGPPFPPYGFPFTAFLTGKPPPYVPAVATLANFLRRAGADETAVRRIAFGNAATLLGLEGQTP